MSNSRCRSALVCLLLDCGDTRAACSAHCRRLLAVALSPPTMSAPQSSVNNAIWQQLMGKLMALDDFRIHTGNINNYVELKLKRFANSAEELVACLDLQFAALDPNIDVT